MEEIIQERAYRHDFVDNGLANIRKMIIEYGRVLQVLQLKEAQRGLDVEPSIILGIQDMRTKIEELKAKLKNSETRTDYLIGQILE